jgi:hypothetical protein
MPEDSEPRPPLEAVPAMDADIGMHCAAESSFIRQGPKTRTPVEAPSLSPTVSESRSVTVTSTVTIRRWHSSYSMIKFQGQCYRHPGCRLGTSPGPARRCSLPLPGPGERPLPARRARGRSGLRLPGRPLPGPRADRRTPAGPRRAP